MAEIRSGHAEGFKEFLEAFNPDKEDEPYYAAIGRLIVQYAACEGAVQMLARRLSKLDDNKARVIFAGMRTRDIIERIHAMWLWKKRSAKATQTLKECLIQYEEIGKSRDKIAHRFSNYNFGKIWNTNILTAKKLVNAERDSFSLADLKNMYSDCLKIYLLLEGTQNRRSKESRAADRLALRMLKHAWRYKPPAQQAAKKQYRAGSR